MRIFKTVENYSFDGKIFIGGGIHERNKILLSVQKCDVHYAEFGKMHMGTLNLTEDGVPIDSFYREMLGLFSEF